jgi:hypothetical protein
MTFAEFKQTLEDSHPPGGVSKALTALWFDARGDWDRAHHIAQDLESTDGAWVHAYLHRKEGDVSNAGYWYRRAGQPECSDALEAEWTRIVTALIERD